MKGTTLLQRQHRRVEQLLDAIEGERYLRGALLRELADDLAATMTMEEAIFYPAVRDALGSGLAPAFYGDEDHAMATRGLQRLFEAENDADRFQDELVDLRRLVRGHFDLEERTVFPSVEQALSGEELERIGDQMRKLHRQIVEADGEERISSIGVPSRADWYGFDLPQTGS
jgi:iron-sulfur cluster repair protein YtfE (RIC family)